MLEKARYAQMAALALNFQAALRPYVLYLHAMSGLHGGAMLT